MSQEPILPATSDIPVIAKAMPPARRSWGSPRERVMRLLDYSRRQRFTFLSAPAGYGKTTALADWYYRMADAGERVVWFSADRRDREPECFWVNFHSAVYTALGLDVEATRARARSMARDKAIITMANELSLAAREAGDVFIIVEGFDVISGYETLDELLSLMLALSGSVHMVLSSRERFSKHGFEGHTIPDVVLSISHEALRLTRDEIACELAAACPAAPTEDEVRLVEEKTLGWAAAVGMLLDDIAAGKTAAQAAGGLNGTDPRLGEVFEYEVFSTLEERERSFLLRTSSFAVLSERIAGYTLGDGDYGPLLDHLAKRNALIFPNGQGRGECELHPLFSQWLMREALSLPAHEHRTLNARAARWCLRNGLPVPAAKHKILASEREDIFNLVRVAYPEKSAQALMEVTLFRGSPVAEELGPCFWLLAAWAYAYAAELEELDYWRGLLQKLPAEERSRELDLSLEVLEVKALCLASRFREGVSKAHYVEPKLRSKSCLPLNIILTNCYAEALDQQGNTSRGMERHLEFSSLTSDGSFTFLTAINTYEMAFAFVEQGELGRAAQLCRSIQASAPPDYMVRGAAGALGVLVDLLQGLGGDAAQRLEGARSLISRTSNPDMFLDWCTARGWAHALDGDLEAADAVLAEGCSLVKYSLRSIPRTAAVLPFQNRALLRLMQGRGEEAIASYHEFDQMGLPTTMHSSFVREFVDLGLVEDAERGRELGRLLGKAEQCGYRPLAVLFGIELALDCFACGQRTKAVRELDRALRTAQASEMVAPFLWKAGQLRQLIVVYLTTAKPDYMSRRFAQALLKLPALQPGEQDARDFYGGVELSSRETEIAKLVLAGMSRQEIAAELCVGESTVKSHLSHIYRKFGVHRYSEFLEIAAELGIS